MRTRTSITLDNSAAFGPLTGQQQQLVPPQDIEEEYNINFLPRTIRTDYEESSMTDDDSSNRQYKECLHTYRKFTRLNRAELQIDVAHHTSPTDRYVKYWWRGPMVHWWAWGEYGEIFPHNISVSWPTTLQQHVRQACSAFYNINEVDNLTNLVESPQLLTGLSSIMYTAQQAMRVSLGMPLRKGGMNPKGGTLIKGAAWRAPKARLRNAALSASGIWLYNGFGVQPLISDMRKITKSLTSIKGSMARHVAQAGKLIVSHRSQQGKYTFVDMPQGFGSPGQPGSCWHVTPTGVSPTRIVTIQGIRQPRFHSQNLKELDYLITRFVSAGPASFVWERIPYSFVIDWFVDLRGIIDRLDRLLTGANSTIHQCCYSEKYHLRMPVIHHEYSNWPDSSTYGTTTAYSEVSRYYRKPISPDTSVGWSGRFGKRQLAHSAALLTQIVSNLKSVRK